MRSRETFVQSRFRDVLQAQWPKAIPRQRLLRDPFFVALLAKYSNATQKTCKGTKADSRVRAEVFGYIAGHH
jgi:hypothetical protein